MSKQVVMSRTSVQGVTVFEDASVEFFAKIVRGGYGQAPYFFMVKMFNRIADQGNAGSLVDARRIVQGYYDAVVESRPASPKSIPEGAN